MQVVGDGAAFVATYQALIAPPLGALLTGPFEETNEGSAIAKIAALELGKMYRRQCGMDCISLMPTNLYGPNDNYDLAGATVFALKHYTGEQHVNVGVGEDISIRELASLIAEVIGWDGELVFDPTMPDGTPRKLTWTS